MSGPSTEDSPPDAASPSVQLLTSPASVESVMVDGGVDGGKDAGPNCTGAGDPTIASADGGTQCTGNLGQSSFAWALCSCTTIGASGVLATDGFDSTQGGADGGAGGSVGANGNVSSSGQGTIGGQLWTPGNVVASGPSLVNGWDRHA